MKRSSILEKVTILLVFSITAYGFMALSLVFQNPLLKPAQFAQHTLIDQQGSVAQALFSPRDNVKEVLLGLIESEKKSLSIASFRLTDQDIAQALDAAARRGVIIRIIADRKCPEHPASKLTRLAKNNKIAIKLYPCTNQERDPAGLMHNKYIIFEQTINNKPLLWTGSFNFTRSAQTINQENVVILDNLKLIESYKQAFEELYEKSQVYGNGHEGAKVEQHGLPWLAALWAWLRN